MASNLRVVPQSMPPSAQQQDWFWNGTNWVCGCDGLNPAPTPPPCPPPGWPTPCPPWFPPPAGQAPWYPGANGGVSFSATPPANPIRGNFWWDGTMLHLFDGAAWVNIGPGASGSPGSGGGAFVGTSPPSNPAQGALWWNGFIMQVWNGTAWVQVSGSTSQVFRIGNPANLSIATTGWTIVPFTAVPSIDTESAWKAGTNQFMPTIPGYYLFIVRQLGQTGSGGGAFGATLLKNDNGSFTNDTTQTVVTIADISLTGTHSGWFTSAGVAQMNGTTDFVRLFAYSTGVGIFYGTGSWPVIEGYRMP